jgi:hypothetical protein
VTQHEREALVGRQSVERMPHPVARDVLFERLLRIRNCAGKLDRV